MICVHVAQTSEVQVAAENLAIWDAGPQAPKASWHCAVDDDSATQSVMFEDIAWHAGPLNPWSIGIEHAGSA
jgi:N-acetyl-anhydromuramyl-L-alanine amidase AmpD